MGEIADMMLDGTLCEGCGVFLDEDNECHVPRRCRSCQEQDHLDDITRGSLELVASMKVSCPTCRKRVKQAGLRDHMRDKHGVTTSEVSPP